MRLLAKEVLAEVPEQVTSYMRLHGLKPGQPMFSEVPSAPFEQPAGVNQAPYPQQPGVNQAPYPQQPGVNPVPYPQLPVNSTPYPQQPGMNPAPYPQQPGLNPAPYPQQTVNSAPYPQAVNQTPYHSCPANQLYDANGAVNQQQAPGNNAARGTFGFENLHVGDGTPNVNGKLHST
jgi:hypothetical protein